MKFLHTADLHLGRRMNDLPLLDDQKILMQEITDIAVSENVDGVIIAGDIYNKAAPGSDAMMVLDDFVTGLVNYGISIYMISGNHDSSERISYFSKLIRKSGIYTTDAFNGRLQQIHIEDSFGLLTIHLMPFIRPVQVKKFYPDREIINYEDAVRIVLDNSPVNKNERNILVCHQFVTGAEISDSEEFAVGGLDCIDASLFDDFDYVALGHLHKPQKVRRETMRYSGSPMKYSLSEANHKKSVTIIEVKEKGEAPEIRQIPLHAPNDVREVSGKLAEVMEMEPSEDYVRVTLTDEMVPPDAGVTISAVFPNMIRMAVVNSKTSLETDMTGYESLDDKSKMQLFREFYQMQNNGTEPDDIQIEIMEDILKEMEEDRYETD